MSSVIGDRVKVNDNDHTRIVNMLYYKVKAPLLESLQLKCALSILVL